MRPTPLRIAAATGAAAAPGLIGIAVLAAVGQVTPGLALGVAIAVLAMTGALVWAVGRDLLAVGHYIDRLARDVPTGPPETRLSPTARRLTSALAALQDRVDQAMRAQEVEVRAREAIIDALPEAVITVDGDRRLVDANARAVKLFRRVAAGQELTHVVRNPELLEAVDNVLQGAPGQEIEFALHAPVDRIFQAWIAPLGGATARGDGSRAVGRALLVLHEITALKRAEQMRADFIANASHELRTPIATLSGFIETLRGPARGDVEARERFLAIMAEQGERMARLVDDLLSLSRIEQEEHQAPSDAVAVDDVLRRVSESLQLRARKRGMRITLDLSPVQAIAEEEQLTQLFQNLIDNAIKYARAGTVVTVSAAPAVGDRPGLTDGGPAICVEVRDEGPGIPRDHLPRLTERFYRVDAARSRELGGTGLGLAIVKHIVGRHRGRLMFDSTVGVGTTARVLLPAVQGGAAAAETAA